MIENKERKYRPSYISLLESGEIWRRADALKEIIRSCSLCPRECAVDRIAGESGVCGAGMFPGVASSVLHFGEEPPLTGQGGVGNLFFSGCNLRCIFCQNHQISRFPEKGEKADPEKLAGIILDLQKKGASNIGLVSPTSHAGSIVEAVAVAAARGLDLPIIWNSNGYDSVEVIELLEGIVDIYLPDLKYSNPESGLSLSNAPDYPAFARIAIREMFRQLGARHVTDGDGALRRGMIIRLLVLPNGLAGIRESLEWIGTDLSPEVKVSLMAQYNPEAEALNKGRYPLLSRKITQEEWQEALDCFEESGLDEGFIQERTEAPQSYRPDFDNPQNPFNDERAF